MIQLPISPKNLQSGSAPVCNAMRCTALHKAHAAKKQKPTRGSTSSTYYYFEVRKCPRDAVSLPLQRNMAQACPSSTTQPSRRPPIFRNTCRSNNVKPIIMRDMETLCSFAKESMTRFATIAFLHLPIGRPNPLSPTDGRKATSN